MALTSQFNVDLPEAYSAFTEGFSWANLQINLMGSWEPRAPPPNTTAGAAADTGASSEGGRRRRLADEHARSEECAALQGGGDAASTNGSAINATRELARDGTSAYLASLHTSAERFFLNNLVS